jgi:preprotein translocase subunit SecA
MEKKETTQQLTAEQAVKLHKKDHKHIYTIEVDGKYILLSKPNRQTYSECLGLVTPVAGAKPDYITAGLRIMQSSYITSDAKDLFFKDDDYLIPAAMKAIELLDIKEASLKKN